jgi:predicted Rossmann-fold nucleotide-binding protein
MVRDERISPGDLDLLHLTDDPQEVVDLIRRDHGVEPPPQTA